MVIFLYKSENAMSMFPHAFLNKLINNIAYTEALLAIRHSRQLLIGPRPLGDP